MGKRIDKRSRIHKPKLTREERVIRFLAKISSHYEHVGPERIPDALTYWCEGDVVHGWDNHDWHFPGLEREWIIEAIADGLRAWGRHQEDPTLPYGTT